MHPLTLVHPYSKVVICPPVFFSLLSFFTIFEMAISSRDALRALLQLQSLHLKVYALLFYANLNVLLHETSL